VERPAEPRYATACLVIPKGREQLSLILPMQSDTRRVAVALAGFCAFINLYSPQAVLPLLAQEFGVSAVQVGMAMTATTAAIALVAPFVGAVADVLGRKRVIVAAMLALTVPTVGLAFAPSLDVIILCRFMQGLALPPIFAVMVTYIGEEWPPAEATGMTGIYLSASSLGGFLGRLITGLAADWLGWRSAFLIDAAIILVCAAGVAAYLTPERRFVRASNLAAALGAMGRHLRNPQLVGTYAIGFGVLFSFIAVFTYVNFLLAAPPFNLSPSFLGAIFVVYLTGTVVTPFAGRWVQRFGRRRLVLGVFALWAFGLLLTLVPSLPVIIAGLAIFAAAGFLCQTASTSYVAISAKGGASTAVGLYVTAYYIGGSLGAVGGGAAWHLGNWPAVVAMVLSLFALMALIVARVWERQTA
jgi:MFS transporter, YNFM family, putative membrane transport protein